MAGQNTARIFLGYAYLLLAMNACSPVRPAGSKASAAQQSLIIPGVMHGAAVGENWSKILPGTGWNAVSGKIAGTCAIYGPSKLEEIPDFVAFDSPLISFGGGNGMADAAFDSDVNLAALDVMASGSFSGVLNGSVMRLEGKVEGLVGMASNKETMNYVLHGNYIFGNRQFVNQESVLLTKLGRATQAEGVESAFRSCGDHFVTQVNYGADLLMSLRIETLTEEEKMTIKGSVKMNDKGEFLPVKGEGSVAAEIQALNEKTSVTFHISQIGGDFRQTLSHIFKSNRFVVGEGQAELRCDAAHIADCLNLMQNSLAYFKSDFKKQFYKEDGGIDDAGLRIINALASPYGDNHGPMGDRMGCPENADSGCRMLYEVFNEARGSLLAKYYGLQSHLERVGFLLGKRAQIFAAQPEHLARLEKFESRARFVADEISKALVRCYETTDVDQCVAAKAAALQVEGAEALNYAVLEVEVDTLADHCAARASNGMAPDKVKTWDLVARAIMASTGLGGEADCAALVAAAPAMEALNLSYIGELKSLSPVAAMPHLKVLKLQSTRVPRINALEKLAKLRELNLADAGVHSIAPLTGLADLATLDISGSTVTAEEAATVVRTLPKLTSLDLRHMRAPGFTSICPILASHRGLQRLDVSANKLAKAGVACTGLAAPLKVGTLYLNRIKNFDLVADCPAARCVVVE